MRNWFEGDRKGVSKADKRRNLLAAGCAGALIAAPAALAQSVDVPAHYDISDIGGAYDEAVRESRYVPVRDGTELAVNIYRPAVNGAALDQQTPVIFVATPYRARYRDASGALQEVAVSDRLGLRSLIANGYTVVVADIRGKGASYGYRRGFQDRTEALDSHDLIEWSADQSWSTGRVGMLGCSYLGGSTLHAATTAPPSLEAVFVGATDIDKYLFVRRGGLTAQFNTRPDEPLSDDLASLPVDSDEDGSRLERAVAQHAFNTPMAPLWYGMPFRDSLSAYTGNAYWEEASPYNYLETLRQSDTAFYFWGNWEDEPNEQVVMLAENLGGRLIVAEGSHCVPARNGVDFSGEIVRFFDSHLRDADNGFADEPRYKLWFETPGDEGHWVFTDQLPFERAEPARMYLSDGGLSPVGPGLGSQSFEVDYDVATGEYFAFWPTSRADFGAHFASAPLDAPLTIAGYPVIHLTVTSDQDNPEIFAFLEAISPEDEVEVLSFGRLAGAHRTLSEASYDTFGLPWHSGRSSDYQPVGPGETVSLEFYMLPQYREIAEGTRLRVVVTGADPRQRNLDDIRRDPAPNIQISFGEDASWIDIPALPHE